MSLENIRALSKNEVIPWSTLGRLKAHHISRGQGDLWLYLNAAGLESIAVSRTDGWRVLSTKLSPLRNLCTGEILFLLRLSLAEDLEGAEVFLDGRKIQKGDWLGPFIEVSAGEHELRVEKEGYEPIVKLLSLDAEDRGEQRLFLTRPQPGAPAQPNGHGR